MGMKIRSFFPSDRTSLLAGFAVAVLLAGTPALTAQDAAPATPAAPATQTTTPPAQADVTPVSYTHLTLPTIYSV